MAKAGLSARLAALSMLNGVLVEKRALSELTDPGSDIMKKLSGSERARAQSLVQSTLRHLEPLDMLIDFYLKKEPPVRARHILRICATELLVDGISPHAAIDSAVNMAKVSRHTSFLSGLVNAVCRKLDTEGREHWEEHPTQQLPYVLRKMVIGDHGEKAIEAIEEAHVKPVPLDITVKSADDVARLSKELDAEVIGDRSLRLHNAGQISKMAGYEDGAWWVQDVAASLPAKALGDVAGQTVLDLCAAPGGKTLQLAAAGGDVTAADLSKYRLERVRENLVRTGLSAVVVTADVLTWDPLTQYDAILLDAPCSATGTIRRHPDLPHLKDKTTIKSLVELQRQMLDRSFAWLKPGGMMVYSTCSLFRAEGEDQILQFVRETDAAEIDPIDATALNIPEQWVNKRGCIRTLPHFLGDQGGMDGFFVARLTKKAG